MKNKSLKIMTIIIALGLVVAIAAHLFTSIRKVPSTSENNFNYSITYKLDGETKTVSGVYSCRFSGFGSEGIDPLERCYADEYTVDGKTTPAHTYTISNNDGVELYIVNLLNSSYLMGDIKNENYKSSLDAPYLEAVDEEGYANESDGTELIDMFDAEIVSWEYPEPIENSFVFAGFSGLHPISVVAMLLVGILTLIACMIFVKKDETITYGVLDKFGIVLNFISVFIVIPFVAIVTYFVQAFQIGPDWIYQVDLCVAPVIAFTIAASVSLRRKGYKISGFFIQFFGPVALVILGVLENIL